VRVGFWPILSQDEPEAALGLMLILCALLEQWENARAYRLCAQIEGSPADYVWNISKSQFSVDDWELEGLDENAAVWGSLSHDSGQWKLTVQAENDMLNDNLSYTASYEGDSLAGLIEALPQAAKGLAAYFDLAEVELLITYGSVSASDSVLKTILKALFHWERKLYLALWGQTWESFDLLAEWEALQFACESAGEFGAWVASLAGRRVMLPLYAPLGEFLVPRVPEFAARFDRSAFPAAFLGLSLFASAYRAQAYDLLENAVQKHPNNLVCWRILAELYWQGTELTASIDTFQRAIECRTVDSALYVRYADLLLFLDANNVAFGTGTRQRIASGRSFVERFVLIEPDTNQSSPMIEEAVAAYRAALELKPDQPEVLYQLLLHRLDIGEEDVWDDFERLITLDTSGERVRSVVESFVVLDDCSRGIEALCRTLTQQPQRFELRLALASAYLAGGEEDAAQHELNIVLETANDSRLIADAERLMLSVDDPEFESHFGEITDLVNAGAVLKSDDVTFLEETIENAPHLASAYYLLALAYLKWGEADDALEVLLDAQQELPDNPDILLLLGQVLWEAGERTLAFEYLNKGVAANPNHVPLLALTGRCLFDDGQDEAARAFLARAEALDPTNASLNTVRAYIAKAVGGST
jgi:tetratricopeptide (TPR) repeat protein